MGEYENIAGIFAPVIAALGILIAYRQWRTAQNKLKLELFEKRLAVYEAVDFFITCHMRKHGDKSDVGREFHQALSTARWLFEPSVLYFCKNKIWLNANDIIDLWDEIDLINKSESRETDPEISANQRKEVIRKIIEAKNKLKSNQQEWQDIVAPYMTLRFK